MLVIIIYWCLRAKHCNLVALFFHIANGTHSYLPTSEAYTIKIGNANSVGMGRHGRPLKFSLGGGGGKLNKAPIKTIKTYTWRKYYTYNKKEEKKVAQKKHAWRKRHPIKRKK